MTLRAAIAAIGCAFVLNLQSAAATSYVSAEPIPSPDVIGATRLTALEKLGFARLLRWSERLVNDCGLVERVVGSLSVHSAITTIHSGNTRYRVAAGGFEGVTNPAFVFTIRDAGRDAASRRDIGVLDNALGYVLSQDGTVHFNPDDPNAYDFPLDYALVTFTGHLEPREAKTFFEYLGTIDAALFSGQFAGFTQIDFRNAPTNNSMIFLQPAAPRQQFIDGLFRAARATPGARYFPIDAHRTPTLATAGVAFPGNDWVAFPDGAQYLANIPGASPSLLRRLADLRREHLRAVGNLVDAAKAGRADFHLNTSRPLFCGVLRP